MRIFRMRTCNWVKFWCGVLDFFIQKISNKALCPIQILCARKLKNIGRACFNKWQAWERDIWTGRESRARWNGSWRAPRVMSMMRGEREKQALIVQFVLERQRIQGERPPCCFIKTETDIWYMHVRLLMTCMPSYFTHNQIASRILFTASICNF